MRDSTLEKQLRIVRKYYELATAEVVFPTYKKVAQALKISDMTVATAIKEFKKQNEMFSINTLIKKKGNT
jgi:Mn-dependent DtxR family transcriptional regulator